MALEYELRAFTVDEYHRMAEIGVLRRGERVELLDGAIVEMSPIGARHRHIVEYLTGALGRRAAVAGQTSLVLRDCDEPQRFAVGSVGERCRLSLARCEEIRLRCDHAPA